MATAKKRGAIFHKWTRRFQAMLFCLFVFVTLTASNMWGASLLDASLRFSGDESSSQASAPVAKLSFYPDDTAKVSHSIHRGIIAETNDEAGLRNLSGFARFFILPSGTPMFLFRDTCVSTSELLFVARSEQHRLALVDEFSKCCDPSVPAASRQPCFRPEVMKWYRCGALTGFGMYMIRTAVSNTTISERPERWVTGSALLMDVAVTKFYQYGHAVSRFVQTGYLDRSIRDEISTIFVNRQHRLPGGPGEANIQGFYNMSVGQLGKEVVLGIGKFMCADKLYFIPHFERPFWQKSQADEWRNTVTQTLGIEYPTCPKPRACFLKRASSDGRPRGFTNEHVIDEMAAEFGFPRVDRITISAQNTTAETARLFSSCSLFFSGHSSQLKSLYFANPNTAVVEIIGSFIPYWRISPFAESMEELSVHYILSRLHTTNLTECGSACTPATGDKNSRITVNATILRRDLTGVLTKQRAACPELAG